jgi:hypothetical protein
VKTFHRARDITLLIAQRQQQRQAQLNERYDERPSLYAPSPSDDRAIGTDTTDSTAKAAVAQRGVRIYDMS